MENETRIKIKKDTWMNTKIKEVCRSNGHKQLPRQTLAGLTVHKQFYFGHKSVARVKIRSGRTSEIGDGGREGGKRSRRLVCGENWGGKGM